MNDHGYAKAAAEYERWLFSGGNLECEPKVIRKYVDEDGYHTGDLNCEECDNQECEYWKEYNNG